MKLTLLIRIFALLILLFSVFGIGVKSISIHQQTVQEDYYQTWASDEAILTQTLAEFEAMRKLVLLYAASAAAYGSMIALIAGSKSKTRDRVSSGTRVNGPGLAALRLQPSPTLPEASWLGRA